MGVTANPPSHVTTISKRSSGSALIAGCGEAVVSIAFGRADGVGLRPAGPEPCAAIKGHLLQKRAAWLSVLEEYTRARWLKVSYVARANLWDPEELRAESSYTEDKVSEAIEALN